MSRSRVLILHTGGTLGMRPREPDRALEPDEIGATVLEHVPELERLAEIDPRVLLNVDSSDVTPADWMRLAREIHAAYDRYAGVVVTHGTDAMAYTAAALSFVLRDVPFPVILTGSQRPLVEVHTDARGNLVGAVDLALRPLSEVAIYFDGLLLRGNRAVKSSTFAFGAFRSPKALPLAEVGASVRMTGATLTPRGPFRIEGEFDPRVALAWLTPGDDGAALRALADSGVRAVLVAAFGSGNLPVRRPQVAEAIRSLVAGGVVVAIASQAHGGSVNLERYVGGRLASELGAVGIGDMTLEAALVKLMYLCGSLREPAAVRNAVGVPIAGELTP